MQSGMMKNNILCPTHIAEAFSYCHIGYLVKFHARNDRRKFFNMWALVMQVSRQQRDKIIRFKLKVAQLPKFFYERKNK